jgi:phosphoglycerate kinase
MMRTIDDLDVAGLRVLVRADMNVPLDGTRITDDGRIRASLPTLRALLARGARVVVCAHLGRPGGEPDPRYSLAPVAARLGELLGCQVVLAADTVGPAAQAAVAALRPGAVVMLENLRFNAGETSKDDAARWAFAGQLAALADVYVADGFGVVHRKHASVYEIAMRLPHAAGYLLAAETAALGRLAFSIERPYVVVIGGAKVADKLPMVGSLLDNADQILIGGAMAFTFLAARGYPVGSSLVEPGQIDTVRGYLDPAQRDGAEIVLPADVVVAPNRAADAPRTVVPATAIPPGQMGLDIGPKTASLFAARLATAKTVFWNGPMGLFELPAYADGTRAVAQGIIDSGAYSVVGGGDTTAAVRALGFADTAFGYLSTGGGASLEYLQGQTVPGLAVLQDDAAVRL